MSPTLIIPILGIFIILLSQFGGKVNARSAFTWWMIFAFVLFCTAFPELLEPVTHFLGIQVVSNFVLASLILFLFFYSIQESSMLTQVNRKQRELNSSLALSSFLQMNKNTSKKTLVFFPCFNEEGYLPILINQIRDLENQNPGIFQFCIINDGSFDQTENILKNGAHDIYVNHPVNSGVSGVLLTAFKIGNYIEADYVIQVDSDGQHPLEKIPFLLNEAKRTNADLLIGSRFMNGRGKEQAGSTTSLRTFGSFVISILLKMFSSQNEVTDPTSGFRVYSKNSRIVLTKSMPDEYPEPESVAILISSGMKVVEVPVSMNARLTGTSTLGGIKGAFFMTKVSSALLGLRLRTLF
jgi:hypothetical protein